MYTMYCDDIPFYSPFLADQGYEILNPKLTLELNKAGSLTFILPPNNLMYNNIKKLKSVITVLKDDEEIFRGRVLNDKKDFYKRKEVYCEGELAYLNDSVQRPYAFSGSVRDLFKKYIDTHNSEVDDNAKFEFGIVTIEDIDVPQEHIEKIYTLLKNEPSDWNVEFTKYYRKSGDRYISVVGTTAPEWIDNTFYYYNGEAVASITKTEKENTDYSYTVDEIMKQLIDEFGGYLRIRHENGKRYLDYVSRYGSNSEQVIMCGENMLDLSEHISAENLITCLIPYGAEFRGEKTTISKVNGGRDYITNPVAIEVFGKIWGYQDWSDVDNPQKLYNKAVEYLNKNIEMSVSLSVSAVDLNLIDVNVERIKLGDSIRVVSIEHGLDAFFLCSKIDLNLWEADKSSYTMGYSFNAMTEEQIDSKMMLEKSINLSKKLANTAQKYADNAQDSADRAQSTADNAKERADNAKKRADNAYEYAEQAAGTANNAYRAINNPGGILDRLKALEEK